MNPPDFIAHHAEDNVGVVVVEDATRGKMLAGWVSATNGELTAAALDDIPLGHKIALADLTAGATVIKYGQDIGRAVADIPRGSHVHTHNLKTKRW